MIALIHFTLTLSYLLLQLVSSTDASCTGAPAPCSSHRTIGECKAADCSCSVGGKFFSRCDCNIDTITIPIQHYGDTYTTTNINCPSDHKGDFKCSGRNPFKCDFYFDAYAEMGMSNVLFDQGPARNSGACQAAGCHWCDVSAIDGLCAEVKCNDQEEEKISESFFAALELITPALDDLHVSFCDTLEITLHDYVQRQIQKNWPNYKMAHDMFKLPSGPRYHRGSYSPDSPDDSLFGEDKFRSVKNSTVLGFCYGTCGCIGPPVEKPEGSNPPTPATVPTYDEAVSNPPSTAKVPVAAPSGGLFWELPTGTRSSRMQPSTSLTSADIVKKLSESANSTFLEALNHDIITLETSVDAEITDAQFYSSWADALCWVGSWDYSCLGGSDTIQILPISEEKQMYCTTSRPTSQPTVTWRPSSMPTISPIPTVSGDPSSSPTEYPTTKHPTFQPSAAANEKPFMSLCMILLMLFLFD